MALQQAETVSSVFFHYPQFFFSGNMADGSGHVTGHESFLSYLTGEKIDHVTIFV